ncbi:MAG: tetratricopeptide repeat protein [Polyangia bacterium]
MRRGLLLAAIAVGPGTGTHAAAQGVPPPPAACGEAEDDPIADEFRVHYKRAVDLYRARDFAAAIREMQTAYRLKPVTRLLFNIGQAHRKLHQPREAIAYFELYLRTDLQVPQDVRAEISSFLAELRIEAEEQERTKVLVVQKTNPPSRALRPLGAVLLGLGLGSAAAGVPFLVLDGQCAEALEPPARVCNSIYATRTVGASLLGAAGGLLIIGGALLGASFRKPVIVRTAPPPPPPGQLLLPSTPIDLDSEPAPAPAPAVSRPGGALSLRPGARAQLLWQRSEQSSNQAPNQASESLEMQAPDSFSVSVSAGPGALPAAGPPRREPACTRIDPAACALLVGAKEAL